MLRKFFLLFGVVSFIFGVIFSLMMASSEISSLFTQMVLPLSFLISLVSLGFYGVLSKLAEILKAAKIIAVQEGDRRYKDDLSKQKAGEYLWEKGPF